MDIHNFLHELGIQMGLGGLSLNENRAARLMFDGKWAVDFEADEDFKTVQVYSVIAPVPAEEKEALFARLLEANLFGYSTGGAVFSVDPATSDIVLFRTVAPDKLDFQEFVNLLEEFVGTVEKWSLQIAGGASEAASLEPRWDGHLAQSFLRA